MSNKGEAINKLLNIPHTAAPDITRPLKLIGGGDMLRGVKNIHNYGFKDGFSKGKKHGIIEGLMICGGVLLLIPKGVNFVKKKVAEKKEHDEMGEKIHTAFSDALTATPTEEIAVDEGEIVPDDKLEDT